MIYSCLNPNERICFEMHRTVKLSLTMYLAYRFVGGWVCIARDKAYHLPTQGLWFTLGEQ